MLANITKQYIVTTLGVPKPHDEDDECTYLHKAPYFIRMRSAEPQIIEERLKDEMDEQIKKWKKLLNQEAIRTMHITLLTQEDTITKEARVIADYDGFKFRVWPHRVPHLFVPEVVDVLMIRSYRLGGGEHEHRD